MAEIIPFRGIRYNIEKIGNYNKVIAPPYDVISEKMQEDLYRESEFNIVRLINNKSTGEDRYLEAARNFKKWQAAGILSRDKEPAIYVYEQDFEYHSQILRRKGFIAALKLKPMGEGLIYPHERTMSKPREDRLKLLKATDANLSPIFALYIDGSEIRPVFDELTKSEPQIKAKDPTNVVQKLWSLTDKEKIETIQKAMKGKELFIADGHHRYETSLLYKQEQNKSKNGFSSSDYTMVMFIDMDDEGVVIKPAHRVVDLKNTSFNDLIEKLKLNFDVNKSASVDELLSNLKQKREQIVFGLSDGENSKFLTYKGKHEFDLIILHRELERVLGISAKKVQDFVEFVADPNKAFKKAQSGNKAVFFVNPTNIETVKNMARAHKIMPQKSTYFYPKLTDGLVIRKLD
ncbi:MAG: DUF1015 domain-containing protein [Actinobacteria bacterium]|nr:MAG: DUF1015 domain-containing protein [Actinomycetota bacterium]